MTGRRHRATLSSPMARTNTEEQYAREKELRDLERAKTRRVSFRIVMARAHGCTGRSCASEQHEAHLSGLRDCLMALGILPDPQAQWERSPGYAKGKRKAASPETPSEAAS